MELVQDILVCKTYLGNEVGFDYSSGYIYSFFLKNLGLFKRGDGTYYVGYDGGVLLCEHPLSDTLHRVSAKIDEIRTRLSPHTQANCSDLSVVDFDRFRLARVAVSETGYRVLDYRYPVNLGRRMSFSKTRVPQPRIARGSFPYPVYTKGSLEGQPFGWMVYQYRYGNSPPHTTVTQVIRQRDGYTHRWEANIDLKSKRGYTDLKERTYVDENEDPDPYAE